MTSAESKLPTEAVPVRLISVRESPGTTPCRAEVPDSVAEVPPSYWRVGILSPVTVRAFLSTVKLIEVVAEA